MESLINYLQKTEDLLVGKPAKDEDIYNAEKALDVKFADEYITLLKTYGFVCVDGHEITGITNSKRLNVCDVTIKERVNIDNDMKGLYVIEQSHIDGIVIWQSASGEVYQTDATSMPEKIADNIVEYLFIIKRKISIWRIGL